MDDNKLKLQNAINSEIPINEAWCVYKWHYKTFKEHSDAFDNDEFGLQTCIAFYPSGIYMYNNAENTQELDKKGIEWEKYITHAEFRTMYEKSDVNIAKGTTTNDDSPFDASGLYDWQISDY